MSVAKHVKCDYPNISNHVVKTSAYVYPTNSDVCCNSVVMVKCVTTHHFILNYVALHRCPGLQI